MFCDVERRKQPRQECELVVGVLQQALGHLRREGEFDFGRIQPGRGQVGAEVEVAAQCQSPVGVTADVDQAAAQDASGLVAWGS